MIKQPLCIQRTVAKSGLDKEEVVMPHTHIADGTVVAKKLLSLLKYHRN
jgi:hypothetical protein